MITSARSVAAARPPWWVVPVVRAVGLAVALVLVLFTADVADSLPYLTAALAVALFASAPWPARLGPLVWVGEIGLLAAVVALCPTPWALLPVLAGPLASALLVVRPARHAAAADADAAAEHGARDDDYDTANRLLAELQGIARALPGGLDEQGLALGVLQQIRGRIPYDRGVLYSLSEPDGVPVPTAAWGSAPRTAPTGTRRWDDASGEAAWRDEPWRDEPWREGPVVLPADAEGRAMALLPLALEDRHVGLVVLDRLGASFSPAELRAATALTQGAALRLDTARLFGEVRALATTEERRRLAREIHDGVAQEVASLGYVVDDLAARCDAALRPEMLELRAEVTRITTELRLSIFDLRSQVGPGNGLGAALTSYVRHVAAGAGLTVHLVLDESASRLDVEAETELLRIAQEAVTNARRHADAHNLWVTCRVDPPGVYLRVADDGRGLSTASPHSFGMEIMRERATRLGARLTVRGRVGGGTVVEVERDAAPAAPREVLATARSVSS